MDKIKAFLRKIQSSVTVKMNKQPLITTLIVLFVINFIILIISAIIATSIAPDLYPNFFSAFSKGSIKWMLSANSINYIDDPDVMLLAGIVVVIEIVLFSGTIIALTTNGLRNYFTMKTQAKGKLILENHLVILNWNSKVTEILNDLRYKGDKVNVIILSERDKDFVRGHIDSLKSTFDKTLKSGINFIVRQGDPFSRSDLSDICIGDAKSIIIMADDTSGEISGENLSRSDLNSLKMLLLIGSFKLKEDCNIVVEVEAHSTEKMLTDLSSTVESLKDKRISAFSFNRKLGQILAQTVYEPKLASVYLDLLSFKGDEFYSTDNLSVEEYLSTFTESIPIINLNKLFVLTSDVKNLNRRRTSPYKTERRLTKAKDIILDEFTLFVIGENKKSKYMLENLKRKDTGSVKIQTFKKEENDRLIAAIKDSKGRKEVLILSDDTVSTETYDANVFLSLIHLHNNFHNDPSVSFITEILDPKNVRSVRDFGVRNAIVSNRLISLIIAQMALSSESKEFYEQLLLIDNEEEEGFDILIENAENLIDMKQNLSFKSKAELVNAFYYSFDRKFMLIGIIKDDIQEYLCDDLDKNTDIEIRKGDQLILIKY